MVEFRSGSREPPRCPEKRHYRLGVEYKAVQAVAVARPGHRRIRSLICLEASTLCMSAQTAHIHTTRTGAKLSLAPTLLKSEPLRAPLTTKTDLRYPNGFSAILIILNS